MAEERRAPLIILCPMRSFSSVVCAVLGQHPQTYGLPEVNLFMAPTVGELMNAHASRPHGAHGLLRTLAQLQHGEQTESTVAAAQGWLDERSDWTTGQVFEFICEQVAPKIAVDKTPRTVLSPAYLERAYESFPDASFLHLTRHPRSTGKSLLNNLKRNSEWGGTFDADRVDPENIWLRAHTNITEFASTLPEGQCLRIKGEDLLTDPDLYLPQICEWLGIDTSAEAIDAMLHPERSPYACYGPENAKMGNDPEFLEKPAFRRAVVKEPELYGPLDWSGEEFRKETIKLSRELGYA
ncbi:MAG: sulfotransferase [Pseudomonadota bacterium]